MALTTDAVNNNASAAASQFATPEAKLRDVIRCCQLALTLLEQNAFETTPATSAAFKVGNWEIRPRADNDSFNVIGPGNPPPIGVMDGGVHGVERGADPWHPGAFPPEFRDSLGGNAPPRPRGQGWFLLNAWGNAIGYVADGTTLKDAAARAAAANV